MSPTSSKRPMIKEQMAQFNQSIMNGAKQLESQRMKMMKEAEHNNGMVGGQPMGEQEGTSPNASTLVQQTEAAAAFRAASQDMQHKQESQQMKIALDRQKLQNMQREASLKDAKTAADIARK